MDSEYIPLYKFSLYTHHSDLDALKDKWGSQWTSLPILVLQGFQPFLT